MNQNLLYLLQKKIINIKFIDIIKSERVCQRTLQNALYKIIHIVKPS